MASRSVSGRVLVEDYMTVRMITTDWKHSVLDVAKLMVERNASSVAITGENDRIVGILTERDVTKVVANGIAPAGVTAGSLMSFPVVSVKKGTPLEDAARLMVQKKLRHLVVEDPHNHQAVGIVTVTDIARHMKEVLVDKELAASEVWELFF